MTGKRNRLIAYFISPHGYGHAARACAVIEAIRRNDFSVCFELYTTVPQWFFEASLGRSFGYHELLTDVGMVQKNSLVEDLPATVLSLDKMLPFDDVLINSLSDKLRALSCDLIICDISALGIAVAGKADIPSLLIENFTWDWIYERYECRDTGLMKHAGYLKGLFDRADYHIQTEPVCKPGRADLMTGPICRGIRNKASDVRKELGISEGEKAIIITMGGIAWDYTFLDQLGRCREFTFVIPGGSDLRERRGNLILLPRRSDFYHPDLVNACDVLIGKAGYSTIAETWQAGIPFGYVSRRGFPESEVLEAYIESHMHCMRISEDEFMNCNWISGLSDLLSWPRIERDGNIYSDETARFILKLLS